MCLVKYLFICALFNCIAYVKLFFKLYIGGVPNFQEGLVVYQNFTGCIENMYLNNTNVIQDLKQGYENGEAFKFQKFNTLYSCPVSSYDCVFVF